MAPILSRQRDHRGRFIALLVILGIVLAGAVVATIVYAQRDRPAPFSDFTAEDDDPVRRAQLVGDHVTSLYVGDNGDPLTTITAGEDLTSDVAAPSQTVAVAADHSGRPVSFEPQNVLFYKLCGPADDCGFGDTAGGGQSELTLSARQAKEVALRGLKDVPEASAVIVVAPPGFLDISGPAAERPDTVFYFRRDDVKGELDHPLRDSVPEPVRPEELGADDISATMEELLPSLYTMRYKQTGDNTGVIYDLIPPPPPS